MISRHKEIDLDEAVAGTVLSREVLDGRGGVLLPQGTALTETLLNSLRRRGIDRVFVVNEAISEHVLRAERERVQQRLATLFRKARGEQAAEILLATITQHRLEALQ
jgi:hypothetical protein